MTGSPYSEVEVDSSIDLSYYFQVFVRHWLIVAAVFLATTGSAVLYVHVARPVYVSTALVLIEKEQRQAPGLSDGGTVETSADDYYQTQYKIIKSRTLLEKVYTALNLRQTEDFAGGVGALMGAVSVSPVRSSRLVNVSAHSHSPELAAKVANAVAKTFVQQNLENKLFISKEILATLYPKKGGKPPAPAAGAAADLWDQEIDYNSLPAVVKSPIINQLKLNYAQMETRWGDVSTRYTPEHPERARLKSQMEALSNRIEEEIQRIVGSMRAELSGQFLGNNIRIIDPAEVPGRPAKPDKRKTLMLAILLGLGLGYLAALAVDALDQSIHTQDDVEAKLGLACLGTIPKTQLEEDSARIYRELVAGPDSVTGEALKSVRTMIGFAAAAREMRAMLVTSTIPSEGKSFLSICMAMSFAQIGEKVLLIEGDLRKPGLYRRFAVSKEVGLSHFLAHGKDVSELPFLVQETEAPNLQVLVCGPVPPNPAELLSTPRAKAILDWGKTRYHRIIVDGPPLTPVADSLLWGKYVDSTVFVVKFGDAHISLVQKACQKLKDSNLHVAGAIINQVTKRAASYGDHYYSYSYAGYGTKK